MEGLEKNMLGGIPDDDERLESLKDGVIFAYFDIIESLKELEDAKNEAVKLNTLSYNENEKMTAAEFEKFLKTKQERQVYEVEKFQKEVDKNREEYEKKLRKSGLKEEDIPEIKEIQSRYLNLL